jgi:hypothetical protein
MRPCTHESHPRAAGGCASAAAPPHHVGIARPALQRPGPAAQGAGRGSGRAREWGGGGRAAGARRAGRVRGRAISRTPPPPPSRTKWTRRVPHPVLSGHDADIAGNVAVDSGWQRTSSAILQLPRLRRKLPLHLRRPLHLHDARGGWFASTSSRKTIGERAPARGRPFHPQFDLFLL